MSHRNYGYAAARAYTAYQDPNFLALAVTSWTSARQYTISGEQAASGTMDGKPFNLSRSCQGATLAGGTYQSTDPDGPHLDSLASGLFLVVSALLTEATSNRTYLDAAIGSANFIQSHLLAAYSYNSGIFIEGLVILADIMRNTSTEALLPSTVVATATNTLWQGLDGIIATTDFGGHHIIRALAVLYEHNTTYSGRREYIKKYIGVQYNAVIEKATSGGSNIYGLPWTGPPRTSFSSFNQTVAVTALLSVIQLEEDEPSSKSSDNPTSSRTPTATMTTPPLPPKKNGTGAIVGGVVGGLAILAVTIVCVLLYRRRLRQSNHTPPVVDHCSPQILTHFMATSVPAEISREHHINQKKNVRYPVDTNRGQSSTSPGAVGTDATGRDVQIESTTPLEATESPPNLLHSERREDMPTEELLKLLDQRLVLGRWNDLVDELPPEYDEGRTA
ncbi:hypothetical protein ARMGADRAFT_1169272 [Armillaria gallica]|uniref:Glycoside hydrolase family 76 protein n=1 Tax=Armillaria gallica TaxID=47427 RepID=A0A2H3DAE7_ARMGA|nr:hypothetical protein ARMGADRAFT_1169272 [Armillaria gallica]